MSDDELLGGEFPTGSDCMNGEEPWDIGDADGVAEADASVYSYDAESGVRYESIVESHVPAGHIESTESTESTESPESPESVDQMDSVERVQRECELSEGEFLFSQGLSMGVHYLETFKKSGLGEGCSSEASLQASASRKRNDPRLKQAVRRLQAMMFTENMLTVQEKRSMFADIARGKPFKPDDGFLFDVVPSHRDRISAIEADNRMSGDNAPERVEHSIAHDIFSLTEEM